MSGADYEIVLAALAAMLSPTTLSFSVLVLVVAERPLRTGMWFYLGALTANLAIGVLAAIVLGNSAASHTSTPKTWVLWFDIVAGALLVILAIKILRRPPNAKRAADTIDQIQKVVESRDLAVVLGGALLANAGAFIPIALKSISQTDPSTGQYIIDWVFFSLVALLPLAVSIVLLILAPDFAKRVLEGARSWLERNAKNVAAVIILALAISLFFNGISGLK
ncbi:MAG TPA: GAP family protein [Gaiellaceae bacterium]|nr:GAP family protein [Gaiellaceae bacterium]